MKFSDKKLPEKTKSGSGRFFFQPKLSINNPNDVYEQEANVVSQKILNSESVYSNDTFFKPSIHVKNKIQRQEQAPDSEEVQNEERPCFRMSSIRG